MTLLSHALIVENTLYGKWRKITPVTRVKITGCTSPQKLFAAREQLGGRHMITVAGSWQDRDSYRVEFHERSDAQEALLRLNVIHGIKAQIEE